MSWRAAAVALIALAPYPTVALAFQTALWVQGAIIAGVVGLVLTSGLRGFPRVLTELSPTLRWGLALYAGAAVWGATVGVVSGNPTRYVVSQFASMMLLPLAALAFCASGPLRPRELAAGLGAAAGVALAVHLSALIWLRWMLPPSSEAARFMLRNDIGFAGLAVLAPLVVAGSWRELRTPISTVALLCTAVLLAGSMSRGAWIAAVVGVACWMALAGLVDSRTAALASLLIAAGAATFGAAAYLVARSAERHVALRIPSADLSCAPEVEPRADARLVSSPVSEREGAPVIARLPVHSRALEIDAQTWGWLGTTALYEISISTASGSLLASSLLPVDGQGDWTAVRRVVFLPPQVGAIGLRASTTCGPWLVADLHLYALPNAGTAWLRLFWLRLESMATALRHPTGDGTLAYRLRESRAVYGVWTRSGALQRLVGRGLGAIFPFQNSGWDAAGNRTSYPTASYIHNFYLFLAFKLGVAGIAALMGIGLMAAAAARRALAHRRSPQREWLAPIAAAVWIAYLVWSVSSPEILDFRVAPILGALVAASAMDRERAGLAALGTER
jgi:hypothetical protein